jgi:AAA domain
MQSTSSLATVTPIRPVALARPMGQGVGAFLSQTFPEIEPCIEGILSSDGGGWIGGEEKVGKTFYALEEALSLALGLEVCGPFRVPRRRRVLFIEEEDTPPAARISACAPFSVGGASTLATPRSRPT